MTREEVIENLKILKEDYWETDDYGYATAECQEMLTALDMALEALEQEPCEDAISRQAVLNCLTATGLKKFDYILNARDKIKNLPSVKPQEPKTGRWKRIGYDIYECSICGQDVMTGDICAYRYCHCCGTKMESEEKHDTDR